MLYGILKFSLRERINTKGVRFVPFPDGEVKVVNTKSTSKIDRWAKVSDDLELMELLGPVGHMETESKVLHYAMGIKPCKYPSYTLRKNDSGTPRDIHTVFSVDNPGTKDIDDAISVKQEGSKTIIGVHITDVASGLYRLLDTDDRNKLLEFAMNRASSAYTYIENTPLLPGYLTFNELSLSQGEVRKTISLWLEYENDNLIQHSFDSCYVKNEAAIEYEQFQSRLPTEYNTLSRLSGCTDSSEIIAWCMLKYNTLFAETRIQGGLFREQKGAEMAKYSEFECLHEGVGCLYTHATSPIRRYADLHNQLRWHSLDNSFDLDTLNQASTRVAKFHRKHSVMDLSYACRNEPQKVRVLGSYNDTVRVVHGHNTYTVSRFDTFYDGELVPDTECFIWGILKNGMSTLRIQTHDLLVSDIEHEEFLEKEPVIESLQTFEKEDVESLLNHPLDTFQSNCFEVINAGDDLFGAAPTGSGKTGVAMTAIYKAFYNNKRAIYTSPIKSLSNEKYGDFSKKLDKRVSLLTGDVKLRCTPPGGDGASELLIMTAEILRNKLCAGGAEDPDLKDVSVVIIDECHYINDTDRGTVWEETFMNLPKNVQIVALSATLDKPEKFCAWLNNRRPTKLVQRFDRHVPLFFGNIQGKELVFMDNKNSKTYNWNYENKSPTYAKLVKSLFQLDMCPAIVFCMGRKKCVSAAESITDNLLLPSKPFKPKESASEGEHMQYEAELADYNKVVVEYKRKFDTLHRRYLGRFRKQLESIPGYDDFLTMLQKGVAYHHAAMIPVLREFVEVLFREKLVMAVFATETLGVGIDMPARTVVFTELEKPCGKHTKRYLRTEEFMQMAGRAGRRGRDIKGYVLYYSPNNTKVPYSTFCTIALGKPPQATSQLQITPDFVIRNYAKGVGTLKKSLYSAELKDEAQSVYNEYESIENKIDPSTFGAIMELDAKISGMTFIKLTPKQMKKAKGELKGLLGDLTIEEARTQINLYGTISNCESVLQGSWDVVIDTLGKHSFICEDKLTKKGLAATHMCDSMPMVRSEILETLEDFDIETLVSWLSNFASGTGPFETCGLNIPESLKDLNKKTKQLAELYYEEELDTSVSILMYDWVTHKDISRIMQFSDISSFGSFVKVVLRVTSFIEETKTILLGFEDYEKYNKLENYEERLFHGLVGNDSIYT